MNKWITDRKPTEDDQGTFGYLWVTSENGVALLQSWAHAGAQPWMPITPPEPYVKPKRWRVNYSHTSENWYIWNDEKQVVQLYYLQDFYKHHEAAERIAAVYEEVMP